MLITDQQDLLSETRQSEVAEVIACLKRFRPTKVAVEFLQEKEEALNDRFASYLNGDALKMNEIEQIGFRLAKACSLQKVHAVDWNKDEEGIPDVTEIGATADNEEFGAFTKMAQNFVSEINTFFQEHTLREFLLWLNDPQNIAKGHSMYMNLALTGSDSNPAGAIWTAKYWYYRNLLIYKNLIRLIDSNEERIFVLYGAGHLHLLIQFLKESGHVDVIPASDYLG